MCVYFMFLLPYVFVAALQLAGPADCVYDYEIEKAAKDQKRAIELFMNERTNE
jgi:hypothetical protein